MRHLALVLFASLAIGSSYAGVASAQTRRVAVQPTVDDMLRNVSLQNVLNVRDLGGLRGAHGFIPHGRFFRSATLVHASDEDRTDLVTRGVTLDIDLRTFVEAEEHGDRLSHDRRFAYRHLSLLGIGIADWFRAGNLRSLYLHALDAHQGSFEAVFHAMATHDHGAVLYHCTSGKDRTGMVTALLLDLAGVARATIVRDYAISASYLHRPRKNSPPTAIIAFLDALHAKYGGARTFLAHIGLPESEIAALLEKLGQAPSASPPYTHALAAERVLASYRAATQP